MTAARPGHPIQIRFWIGLLCLFLLSTTICLLVSAAAPAILGWRPVAVTSGSMRPLIMAGDIVVAEPHRGDALGPSTVIVFQDPEGDGLVTHRIEGVTPSGEYTTRGDSNAMADSTPVPPHRVVGVGRLLVPKVGAPLVWAWEGDWPRLVAVALAALAAGWCSRWALLDEFDPWRQGPREITRVRQPLRLPMPGGLKILIPFLALALVLGTAPARSAMTGATSSGGNSILAASDFATLLYLHNFPSPPVGDTVSQSYLPVDTITPTGTILYNYDTNRDSKPGLKLAKSAGLSETDQSKYQTWSLQGPLDLDGHATITVWAAVKDFGNGKAGTVQAALLDCPSTGTSCSTIASGTVADNPWGTGGSGTWVKKTIDLGTVTHSFASNRVLRVKIVVGSNSGDDMWFAYDTTSYDTVLRVERP